jgi:hypothetical protein
MSFYGAALLIGFEMGWRGNSGDCFGLFIVGGHWMRAGHLVIDLWFVVCLYLEYWFLGLYIFGHDCELLLSSLHTTADNISITVDKQILRHHWGSERGKDCRLHVFFLPAHTLRQRLQREDSSAPGRRHHLQGWLFGRLVYIFSAVRTMAGAVWLYICCRVSMKPLIWSSSFELAAYSMLSGSDFKASVDIFLV